MAIYLGLARTLPIPGHLLHTMHPSPPLHVSHRPHPIPCSNSSITVFPIRPESPRWLVHSGLYDPARTVVAQTNANGNLSSPIVLTVYKEILDTLEWEKKEGRTMSPKEIFKTPVARKRLLIGMSAGPFSCVAGNIIASYYLGSELNTAGITDPNDQLKAVSLACVVGFGIDADCSEERCAQCVVLGMCLSGDPPRGQVGAEVYGFTITKLTCCLSICNWWAVEGICG